MMPMHDLIIVGCGPAGASAALAAAQGGVDVLVLEKKDEVGSPVCCGEFVPALILKDIPPLDGFVVQSMEGMEVSLPSGEVLSIRSPGLMIDRARFDSALADAARDAGANIITSAAVTEVIGDAVSATVRGENRSFRGRVIIGTDGPRSRVREAMNGENGSLTAAYQERLPLAQELNRALIYYDHRYVGGYAWLFPRGLVANVGLALNAKHSTDLYPLFRDFRGRLLREGLIWSEKPLYRAGGPIPVCGMGERIQSERKLLAGDAAGTPNPVTGAGIGPAVISGTLAGELAALAVRSGDMSVLDSYREECTTAFPLERMAAIRKEADSCWGTPQGDAVIADYWRGFT